MSSFHSQSSAASSASGKPAPLDLSHLYAETTKLRQPSKMKEYYKFFQIPGIGNLAGGLPHVSFFPYDTLEAQIAKPERWTPSPNYPEGGKDESGDDAVLVSDMMAATKLSSSASGAPADRFAPAHLLIPKSAPPGGSDPLPEKKIDLATALQYGNVGGYPPLLTWVRQFVRAHLHPNVPYEGGPEVILTVGSTDGFSKTLELFVNSWNPYDDIRQRESILCETFVYGNVLSQIQPRGMNTAPVAADKDGMLAYGPGSLEDVLENWDDSKGRRPHLMYTVTMGHNPTGILLGVKRRKQLYEVCGRFDVIIVEDDPYWYLQFPSAAEREAESRGVPVPVSEKVEDGEIGQVSSGYAYLDSLVPSFLRFDVDGRVVRLDTFSKTVAPGCRLGWITAQPALIERFTRITETTSSQPSGFVQSLISELVMGPLPAGPINSDTLQAAAQESRRSLLPSFSSSKADKVDTTTTFSGWRIDGWVRWLEGLRGEYERRMGRMCTIFDEGAYQLKQGTPVRPSDADWGVITKTKLYSFDWPRGGMFVWIRIHFEEHPLWQAPRAGEGNEGEVLDGPTLALALLMLIISKPYLVLASPGSMFSSNEEVRLERGWAYLRVCFAAESEENVDACSKRLVAAIHRFWKFKKAQEVEDLLNSMQAAVAAQERGELGNLGMWLGC